MEITDRHRILDILTAALRAVDPGDAVRAHATLRSAILHIGPAAYDLDAIDRIIVVGGGKAGQPMASALARILGSRITAGAVSVKHGHTHGSGDWHVRFGGLPDQAEVSAETKATAARLTGPIAITEAGHPVPDAAGLTGAEHIVALLAHLRPQDLVVVLLSGGGSALLPLPVSGISLADYRALTDLLLRCGADITEINTVRKHCSRLQGGQLARLAAPAQMATLILSDVVGSPLDAIASGPTVPDPSTFADAMAVLSRYGIADQVPTSVSVHLKRGLAGLTPDTPKPGDPLFLRVSQVVIGDNTRAAQAAVMEARRQGLHSLFLTSFVQGEAREVGKVVAGLAQGIAAGMSDVTPPACVVLGGETTVTIRGEGRGGRNQELALAAAIALDGTPLPPGAEVAIVSLATDGTDGPTEAAGGMATSDTVARGRALGLDARAALAQNDSYNYLSALGDLVLTGPTGTNVNDLILVCVR